CSVILCTFNRCQSLVRALESVASSEMPDSVTWEVLVIDNNSSDGTRIAAEEFCRRYPNRFRYLFEPRQGKSHALNTGIREARGDILAFVDDDVTVEPTWLQNLTSALHGCEWAGSGGRIFLERTFSPPRWLALDGPYGLGGVLVLFDRGDKPGELDWAPYGTNMAFRKVMFEKYGGFRTDLGPPPEFGGEDTEFGRRLISAGEHLRYEPQAIVYHCVPENRVRKHYFLTWYFDFGRGLARVYGRGRDICGIPRPYFSILKKGTTSMAIFALRWMFALKPQQRFFYKVMVWWQFGQIVEMYRLARGAKQRDE
ncbi:MAG: glycosyltransferase family A protein, partial [Candidatus Acidiferrum sp.]